MTATREEIKRYLVEIGVTRKPDKGGWMAFKKIAQLLGEFSGEEKKTYCQWIKEYFEKPITPEEQEKIDTGEWRVDDV